MLTIVFSSRDGLVDYDEFCKVLNLKDSSEVRKLFDTLDQDSNGKLDFKEFVFGLYMMTQGEQQVNKDLIDSALRVFGLTEVDFEVEEAVKIIQESTPNLTYEQAKEKVLKEFNAASKDNKNSSSKVRRLSFSNLVKVASSREDFIAVLPIAFRTLMDKKAKQRRGEIVNEVFSEKGTTN